MELIHFDSLNILTPEKASIIKKYVMKIDLVNNDIKLAEEKGWKINILQAMQAVKDIPEGAATF